jgi:hypothetical protein
MNISWASLIIGQAELPTDLPEYLSKVCLDQSAMHGSTGATRSPRLMNMLSAAYTPAYSPVEDYLSLSGTIDSVRNG